MSGTCEEIDNKADFDFECIKKIWKKSKDVDLSI